MTQYQTLFPTLKAIDWTLFIGLSLCAPLIILLSYRKNAHRNSSYLEHIAMGRKLTLPLFVATLVGTWYGGILGVTDIAFQRGLFSFITQGFFWYISYLLFAFFFIKKIRHIQASTLPEIVGFYFGRKAQMLASFLNLINLIPIAYTISIGLFLQILFGGPLWVNSLAGVLFVALYSSWSGLKAIVYSDLIQVILMFISVVVVVIFAWQKYGQPYVLYHELPPHYFTITSDAGLSLLILWALISLSALVDPNFYHRCLAAKNDQTATRGLLISTVLWFVFDVLVTLGAMYARLAVKTSHDYESGGSAYLSFSLDLLPHGLKGVFLAGVMATILSTLDSHLFLAGTTLSHNLYPKNWRSNRAILIGNIFILSFLALIGSFAFSGKIADAWIFTGGSTATFFMAPLFFSLYCKKKLPTNTFIYSSICSSVTMTACLMANYYYNKDFSPFIFGVASSFMWVTLTHMKTKI